ncbi:hypothetical protein DFJ73DRAFT_759787 [Zopfochytrium polystomum]|nr:hypothetical protein DFJ73DRAFT_759787 [Zopfochytrium polystomum]
MEPTKQADEGKPLPPGWEQHFDTNYGRYYYVDPDGASTWYDPRSTQKDGTSAASAQATGNAAKPQGGSPSPEPTKDFSASETGSSAVATSTYHLEQVLAGNPVPSTADIPHYSGPSSYPSDEKKQIYGLPTTNFEYAAPQPSDPFLASSSSNPIASSSLATAAARSASPPSVTSPVSPRSSYPKPLPSVPGPHGSMPRKQYEPIREDDDPFYEVDVKNEPYPAVPATINRQGPAAPNKPAPIIIEPYPPPVPPSNGRGVAKERRYCCGCFRTRGGCCAFWLIFIIVLLGILGGLVYFLFPRIPTVVVSDPHVISNVQTVETNGTLSTASSSTPFTIRINLGVDISVKSDNYEDIGVSKITFSGNLLSESGSAMSDTPINGIAKNVNFKGKSTTNFTLPFTMTHDVTTSGSITTVVTQDSALMVLYNSCVRNTGDLQISYNVETYIDAISWTGYKPSFNGKATFPCPTGGFNFGGAGGGFKLGGGTGAPAFGANPTGGTGGTGLFGGAAAGGAPAFGGANTGGNTAFGGTGGATGGFGGFGASTGGPGATSGSAFGGGAPAFGASSGAAPAFGGGAATGGSTFGAATTPAFGGATTGAAPAFGGASTGGAPAFGAAATGAASAFGGAASGGGGMFGGAGAGAASKPTFSFGGTTGAPGFGTGGATAGSGTGGQALFGGASNTTTPAFGSGGGAFGSTAPAFGTANQTAAAPAFGASTGTTAPAFASGAAAPAFGTTPLGQAPTFGTGTAGGAAAPAFGSSTTSSSGTTAAPAPSFSFGGASAPFGATAQKPGDAPKPAATGTAAAPSFGGGSLFGGGGNTTNTPLFGGGAATAPAGGAAKPLFGGSSAAGTSAAGTTTTSAASTAVATLFGGGSAAAGTPAGGAAQTTTPLFGGAGGAAPSRGFRLWGKSARGSRNLQPRQLQDRVCLAGATAAATGTNTPGPLSLKDLSGTPSGGASTATASAAPSLFGGSQAKPAGASALATPARSTTAAPATSTATPSGGLKSLKGKSMEEILNKWQLELDQCTRDFHRQAEEIMRWDRMLIENGHTITKLYESVGKVDEEQNQIEQTLEYIESQQSELNSVLGPVRVPGSQPHGRHTSCCRHRRPPRTWASPGWQARCPVPPAAQTRRGCQAAREPIRLGAADEERERAYSLAESLNREVNDLGRQLASMIEEVNSLRSQKQAPLRGGMSLEGDAAGAAAAAGVQAPPVLAVDEPPVVKIVRILDTHLTSLQWLDESADDLGARVGELRRRAAVATEEAERVHRLRGGRRRPCGRAGPARRGRRRARRR